MRAFVNSVSDTIVACATGRGPAAIAIVRLSGREALRIAQRLAPSRTPRRPRMLSRARLTANDGRVLDDILVVEMPGPASHTGEDVAELHLHGAPAAVDAALQLALASGARLAEPGEFMLRAFLNGRVDLSQVEATSALLQAENADQLHNATNVVVGALATELGSMLDKLKSVIAAARATFDFPEHDSGADFKRDNEKSVHDVRCNMQTMVDGARSVAERTRQVAVCGAPNVGKSSLLNAWFGGERVLVDDAPGTTRDPVEVVMGHGLSRWSVWDTAGFRGEASGLEARGIALGLSKAREADLVVWLLAPDAPVWPPAELSPWLVGGKADTADVARRVELEGRARARGHELRGWVSSQSGEGIPELRDLLERELRGGGEGRAFVRERQLEALRGALASLIAAEAAWARGDTLDVVTALLEEAAFGLGQVLGQNVDAAVLDKIFSDFCIGK